MAWHGMARHCLTYEGTPLPNLSDFVVRVRGKGRGMVSVRVTVTVTIGTKANAKHLRCEHFAGA